MAKTDLQQWDKDHPDPWEYLYIDTSHPLASDDNDGTTEALPLMTQKEAERKQKCLIEKGHKHVLILKKAVD